MSNKTVSSTDDQAKPRTLEHWQLEDARRLKALFAEKKKSIGFTELSFAHDHFGGATQGLINQYLNGKIKLNLESLLKFAIGLGCRTSDISPVLSELLEKSIRCGALEPTAGYSPEVKVIADIAESLDSAGKKAICEAAQKEQRIKAMTEQIKEMAIHKRIA